MPGKMTIVLFGATGSLGKQLLQQGLLMGHKFRLLCRSAQPAQLADILSDPASKQSIELIKGDATSDQSAVDSVLSGADVAIVTLGGSSDVCSRGQRLINQSLASMTTAGKPRRMIVVTSLGVGDSYQDLNWVSWLFVNLVIRKVVGDKGVQEELVKQSGIPWTIVRPVGLTDGPLTEKYLAKERGIGGGMISRADVAHFILRQCVNDNNSQWTNKALTITSA
jgi:uncharacterized protein YbjT (DUF2867 family)